MENANNKISFILVFVILLVSIISITRIVTATNGFSTPGWSMFHHDPLHSGYSTSTAPNTNNVLWNYTTDDFVYSSPTVVDGMVYIGSNDGYVYCLDAKDGSEHWNTSVGGEIWFSSPAVAEGRVYIGGNSFNCLNANNGSIIWIYPSGLHITSSPAVVNDRVYVGTWFKGLCCFDADPDDNGDGVINHNPDDEIEDDNDEGYNDIFTAEYDLIWNYETDGMVLSSPAVYDDKVYIGSRDNKVYCLYSSNGTEIWNYTTGGDIDSSPAIYEGKVYVGSQDKKIYCLYTNNGTEIWNYTTQGIVKSSPAVAYGKVYIGSDDKKLYCLNAKTGESVWDSPFVTGGTILSSPAIADGKVYFGSIDKKVYCLNATNGIKLWEYETQGRIEYSSPAVYNNKLYIGSYDKKVYCFKEIPETNEAPRRPSQPIGQTDGTVDIEYTFATTTTDPEGDPIYYWFDWGDNTNSGWITSSSKSHHWSQEGTYQIKVKAKDNHGAESTWSNPSTIDIVEQTTEEPEPKGWTFGSVYDAEGEPIAAASVCVVISDVKQCVLTDEDGLYQVYVEAGDHTVEVKKEGYETQTKTVTVIAYQAFNENFIMEESEVIEPIVDENRQKIDDAIAAGDIGGEITFQKEEQQISHVEIRYADITITPVGVDPENKKISLIVDGEETTGKTIVITVDNTVFDMEDATIDYDGIQIKEADGFLDVLDSSNDGSFPEYYIINEPDGTIILVSIPHFSEHEITISSVVEAISVLTAVMLFISVTIAALLVFIVPVYHFYFRKVKE